jgi:hypothetical protein
MRPDEGRINMAHAKTPGRENAFSGGRGLLMTVHGKGKQTQTKNSREPHSVRAYSLIPSLALSAMSYIVSGIF